MSDLPPGKYSALIGLVEVDFTNAGQRVFDITCGGQTLASNLDIFAAAGGAGKVYFISSAGGPRRRTPSAAADVQFHRTHGRRRN